ncbi:CU044_5270 family protein [Streptomyces sp. NPDC059209]|uniref:CU044_5270 family protein n=1 Tax=Streptomyces sp. NPDC059209 TaxID=3346769 RepID=UPI0036A7D067
MSVREANLNKILASNRSEERSAERSFVRRHRWSLAGVAVATSATVGFVAVFTLGPTAQPAYAVTPNPLSYSHTGDPAAPVLEEIAEEAERVSTKTPSGENGSQYFEQESWSLSTRIDGIQVTSAIVPERRETWTKPDGSARWKVRTQPPEFENPSQRDEWEDAGSIGEESQEYADSRGPADPSDPRNQPAPTDPAAMGKWLSLGYQNPGRGEIFDSVSERNLDRIFSLTQRTALLRHLATLDGVAYRGSVKDRSGRPGEAFSVRSSYGGLPKVQTLIFDSRTARLLAYEEELTTDAGKLNVKVPAVVLYVTYLEARPA